MTCWWSRGWGIPDSSNRTADLHLSQWPADGHEAGAYRIPQIELLTSIYHNDLLMVTRLGHTGFLKQNCWPPFITMTCWWSRGWGIPDSSNRTAGLHFSQWPTDCHKAGVFLIPHCIYPSDLLVLSWLGHVWIMKQNCWLAFISVAYWVYSANDSTSTVLFHYR